MAKIKLSVKYQDIAVQTSEPEQSAVLHIQSIVMAGSNNPASMISDDPNNNLTLGSDGKLLVDDSTELAYYLLERGNL